MFSYKYHYILLNYTLALLHQYLQHYYGCSFIAKSSKWLFYAKKINYISLGSDFFMFNRRFLYLISDFYMFNKWFSLSANYFYMFNKWFLYSANYFYIQQEIYVFSSLNFVFSNMRFIFNNLRISIDEMKFIKLKLFTFGKPNLHVT